MKPGEVKNVSRCSHSVGRLADLLGQLALGGLQRLLALLVELAGRDLQQVRRRRSPRAAGARATAARRRGATIADRARVADDLALDLLAVLVAEALLADGEDLALVASSRALDALEARSS